MFRISILLAIISLSFSIMGQNLRQANDLNKKGLRLYENGDYDAAIENFTRSIELSSRLGSSKTSLKNNAFPQTGSDAAESHQITVIDPRTAAAYVNRGNAYFAEHEIDRAIADYDRAIAVSPGLAEAYITRGSAWLVNANWTKPWPIMKGRSRSNRDLLKATSAAE